MHAVIQVGSNQFRVTEGDTIVTHLLSDKEGKSLTFDQVLLFSDGKSVQIGQPFLKNIKVTGKVLRHGKGEKVVAFKFRRRENYQKTRGHRQKLTTVNITKITPE